MAAFVPQTNPLPLLGTSEGPEEVVLVSAAAGAGVTATASQKFSIVGECEGIEVTIDFTKVGAAPSVVFTVEAFDVAKNGYVTLLTGAALVATGTQQLLVSHHAPNVTNVSAAHCVRGQMRVTATHGNGDAATYSVSVAGI